MKKYRAIAQLHTPSALRDYLGAHDVHMDMDEHLQCGTESPLGQPCSVGGRTIGNRFAILPMEGWDGDAEGRPTELTSRRWRRFGESGAKLIFGGEAVAPGLDARANPRGLALTSKTVDDLANLRAVLQHSHRERFATVEDLLVGVQISHAGRFCRSSPDGKPRPRILYRHPILDQKLGIDSDDAIITDGDIRRIIHDSVHAAVLAQQAGFDFVDIKHCHGYLGHEFLSAVSRPGLYGGSFENRTRFLREVVAGIRSEAPGLDIAVRLSAFDFIPFQPGRDGIGEPVPFEGRYPYAFGGDGTGVGIDLAEPLAFLDLLVDLNIRLVCITGGCGYYNYHIIRPCLIPAQGSYLPPEEPLQGVARLINVAAELKRLKPQLTYVSSGFSYLQQWLPHVAQHAVRTGMTDFAGLGRMAISYPEMVDDVLSGRPLRRQHVCRGCTRCITAPRNGMVSGCYLTDAFYRERPEHEQLKQMMRS